MGTSTEGRRGRKPSRIDQHDAGQDMMSGYVSHAKPEPEQVEYVRQAAAKHSDRAELVSALLGETTTETATIYADAAGDQELAAWVVEALDDPTLRGQLGMLYELAGDVDGDWRKANPTPDARVGRGFSSDRVAVDEAKEVTWIIAKRDAA